MYGYLQVSSGVIINEITAIQNCVIDNQNPMATNSAVGGLKNEVEDVTEEEPP